jgi:ribosomal-protein-alanine N-acetyltransferase
MSLIQPSAQSAPHSETGELRVRRGRADDLDALLLLEQRSFSSDRLSRRQCRRHLDSASARVLVAVDAQQLLGACVLFFRRRSQVARLYSLAIQPELRGRGVGRALLDASVAAARAHACMALRLEVRTDNAPAIKLYQQAGFVRIGRLDGYYEDGADAWRCELALDGVDHHDASSDATEGVGPLQRHR